MNQANNDRKSLDQRISDYRPSKKSLAWSIVISAILTMIFGFTAGGWVTGGTARLMATVAARDAVAELASTECVNRFLGGTDAAQRLTDLKALSSWQRDDFVKDGGWSQFGSEEVAGAAVMCADKLAAMDGVPETTSSAAVEG